MPMHMGLFKVHLIQNYLRLVICNRKHLLVISKTIISPISIQVISNVQPKFVYISLHKLFITMSILSDNSTNSSLQSCIIYSNTIRSFITREGNDREELQSFYSFSSLSLLNRYTALPKGKHVNGYKN